MSAVQIEIIGVLWDFFNRDGKKVFQWLKTENLNLGGQSPNEMIERGRENKLLTFIQNSLAGNHP